MFSRFKNVPVISKIVAWCFFQVIYKYYGYNFHLNTKSRNTKKYFGMELNILLHIPSISQKWVNVDFFNYIESYYHITKVLQNSGIAYMWWLLIC